MRLPRLRGKNALRKALKILPAIGGLDIDIFNFGGKYIADPCKMHDLCKRGIIFGQLRIKELIGRRAQTAKKQLQRVEARPLFAKLNGRYLSLTDGAFFG